MTVPADPTLTDICTTALQRGGQYNPSSTQITIAETEFIQEVKVDIMRIAANHRFLQQRYTTPTIRGLQHYALPTDHSRTLNIVMLDGPDEWRGTATAGASTTITLGFATPETDDNLCGKYIILTGGTGSGQYRQILSYNPATQLTTIDTAWTTNPDNTTTYLVALEDKTLWPHNFEDTPDYYPIQQFVDRPRRASIFNQEFYIYPTPDKSTYGLLMNYLVDLTKVDEAGSLFSQLLRVWRPLWIQGIACYTMQRYDDERFPLALQTYQSQLLNLAKDNPQYTACDRAR